MSRPLRLGLVLIPLLALNWILAAPLTAPPPRPAVSYTYFLDQVQSANVAEVVTSGETIEGSFVSPAGRFTTRRPSFADDHLMAMLQANGVLINAGPPEGPGPLGTRLLIGLGPALLLTVLFDRFWPWLRRP